MRTNTSTSLAEGPPVGVGVVEGEESTNDRKWWRKRRRRAADVVRILRLTLSTVQQAELPSTSHVCKLEN